MWYKYKEHILVNLGQFTDETAQTKDKSKVIGV